MAKKPPGNLPPEQPEKPSVDDLFAGNPNGWRSSLSPEFVDGYEQDEIVRRAAEQERLRREALAAGELMVRREPKKELPPWADLIEPPEVQPEE